MIGFDMSQVSFTQIFSGALTAVPVWPERVSIVGELVLHILIPPEK
jgi:hypothetical protein